MKFGDPLISHTIQTAESVCGICIKGEFYHGIL
jgi:hypothetical protein